MEESVNAPWLMVCSSKEMVTVLASVSVKFIYPIFIYLIMLIPSIMLWHHSYKSIFAASGPGRCKLNHGGCWHETRNGRSYSACVVSSFTDSFPIIIVVETQFHLNSFFALNRMRKMASAHVLQDLKETEKVAKVFFSSGIFLKRILLENLSCFKGTPNRAKVFLY